MGRPAIARMDLGIKPTPNIHTTLMPPLGLQAHATELGENHWLEKVFKEVLNNINGEVVLN
jgi:hypothetical protein